MNNQESAPPLYYEDYEAPDIGHTWRSGSRRITHKDVERFAEWTGDSNPVHVDAAYAASSTYGERIAHGYLTIAMAAGLVYRMGLDKVASHAILQTNWKLVKALRPGSDISVELTLLSRRKSRSNPEFGIISRRYAVRDGAEDSVAVGEVTMLIFKRRISR